MKASIIRNRARARSISTVVPPTTSADYAPELARAAASILYQSPLRSKNGHAIYILNAAALPDSGEVDYDTLLPYVLARLPGEEELVSGAEYEVVFFAGNGQDGTTTTKKSRPGWGWFFQAYHVLSRAMRKRIQRLYIVHERTWVRVLSGMFSAVVSPKFGRKIIHASTLTQLALHIPIENLLIPPSAYIQDRKTSPDVTVPFLSGRRAFCAKRPLITTLDGHQQLPRVLREATNFILLDQIVKTEGLFRVSAPAKLKDVLKEAYNRGQKFIIFKERDIYLPLPQYHDTINLDELLKEIDQTETYSAHMATGLIKAWYSDLREPIVPKMAYREILRVFGDPSNEITTELLVDFIAPFSEWSPLSATARDILIRHLLPLLHEITKHQESNKMTADNLAVCFAPTFVCGVDPIEDVKISGILRRIITKAISAWPELQEIFGLDAVALWDALKPPKDMAEYEDPLTESVSRSEPDTPGVAELEVQTSGIILKDNDIETPLDASGSNSSRSSTGPAFPPRLNTNLPPLPPRPGQSLPIDAISSASFVPHHASSVPGSSTPSSSHPHPSARVGVPPRYSIAVGEHDMTDSPSAYVPADGFAPPRPGDWSLHDNDVPPSAGGADIQSQFEPTAATGNTGGTFADTAAANAYTGATLSAGAVDSGASHAAADALANPAISSFSAPTSAAVLSPSDEPRRQHMSVRRKPVASPAGKSRSVSPKVAKQDDADGNA